MNAVTETAAAEPVSGVEIFVPLAKLKKSPRNARKVPHGEAAIEALAASIQHKGLIQNLVVEPEVKERSEEHTSELQSLMRISYAVFCLKKKTYQYINYTHYHIHK